MTANKKLGSGEHGLETGISWILIIGLTISLILEIAGIVLLYISRGNLAITQDPQMFIYGHDFFTFIYSQICGERTGGIAVLLMTAGILMLILTPYIRVIASAVYFAVEKNLKFVLITIFVLVVVTISLAMH